MKICLLQIDRHSWHDFGLERRRMAAASYLKSPNDHQSVDVELGNVQADFLQHFSWQSSWGHRNKLHSKKCCNVTTKAVTLKKKKTNVLPLGAQHWASFSSPASHWSPGDRFNLQWEKKQRQITLSLVYSVYIETSCCLETVLVLVRRNIRKQNWKHTVLLV